LAPRIRTRRGIDEKRETNLEAGASRPQLGKY
jgi:hypothetical protein